jgi:hypothetical protein
VDLIDKLQATDFGAYPDKLSLERIEQIENELTNATNARKIGSNMFVSMGDHPELGSVLIMNQGDGTGGFVLADRVTFRPI